MTEAPMPKLIYELHWKELSETGRTICEKKSGLLNRETAFSQHSYCLNLVISWFQKKKWRSVLENPQRCFVSCPTICGTLCLTQILNKVLNVTIQKLILYFSIMSRDNTDFGKTDYVYVYDISWHTFYSIWHTLCSICNTNQGRM